ncbi:MAG TPA: ABC transporter permease [Rubrivivax sp.]|nr:ABC transporter permease [Burkholderiales bacterium]HNT38987.1 ABC transporter permease [Rubrivivax sp.]
MREPQPSIPFGRHGAASRRRRKDQRLRHVVRLSLVCALLGSSAGAYALNVEVPGCGNLSNAFGPWDYRVDRGEPLQLVESAHFTPVVEGLIRGQSSTVAQDLDYTLRAFPNHHRALIAAGRLADRAKSMQPPGLRYPIDCWYERAIRFKPDDLTVRMLFAEWLSKHKREDDALRQLDFVKVKAGDNPFTHYNLGLVYVKLGKFDDALSQAHKAAALGMPRQELKQALQAAGRWAEPAPDKADPAASANAATAEAAAAPSSAASGSP